MNKKVIIINGNWTQRQESLQKIKDFLGEYDYYSFDDQYSYEYVENTILELSCFGKKKMIVINNFPIIQAPDKTQARIKVINKFKKLISRIPGGIIVVFNNLNIAVSSFVSEAKKYGSIYTFDQTLSKQKAASWSTDYFDKKNIELKFDDAVVMVNSLNIDEDVVDVDSLYLLILQVEHYIGKRNSISLTDIMNVCNQNRKFVSWNLFNYLDNQDLCSSLELMKILIDFSKEVLKEVLLIINTLRWKYHLLFMVKSELKIGNSREQIIQKIMNLHKMNRKGKSYNIQMSIQQKEGQLVSSYSQNMMDSIFQGRDGRKPSLQCYSYERLELINYAINTVIERIRFGASESELMVFIETVFMVICGRIKKRESLEILEYKKTLMLKETYDIS